MIEVENLIELVSLIIIMDQDQINSVVKDNYRFLKCLYIKDIRETDFGFYTWSLAD
jgi:hypothetical protein